MPGTYGLSFQPSGEEGGADRERVAPVQEAIRLLSLRLPSVVGARGISPQALLQSQGASALPTSDGMTHESAIALLQRLLQQSRAATPPQLGSQGGPSGPMVPGGRPPVQTAPTSTAKPPKAPMFAPPPPRVTPGDPRPEPDIEVLPGWTTPIGGQSESPLSGPITPHPFGVNRGPAKRVLR